MADLLVAVNPDPDSPAALPGAAAARWWDGVPHVGDVAAGQGAVLLSGRRRGVAGRAGYRRAGADPLVRACVAAIDLVLDRDRENRSQLVFTTAHGRDAVFWQSPRTRKQARPNVSTPTARAAGIAELEILVDTRKQYAYRFSTQQVVTLKRALPCGEYGVTMHGHLVAVVERKSLPTSSPA
jgi:hypothetical protein